MEDIQVTKPVQGCNNVKYFLNFTILHTQQSYAMWYAEPTLACVSTSLLLTNYNLQLHEYKYVGVNLC